MKCGLKPLVSFSVAVLGMVALQSLAQNAPNTPAATNKVVAKNRYTGTPVVAKPATTVTVTTDLKPAAATNEVKEAKPPGDTFTNSVDMVFVKVGDGMWAGKYPVTQAEFQKVMKSNPSAFAGADHPVDSVTYADAVDFCQTLTEADIKEKKLPKEYYYALPTEAEWQSLVGNAELSSAVTSLGGTTRSETSPVGSLAPNSFGLYDIRGNVMEFVQSDDTKPYRILKGGSWEDFVEVNLRPEFRYYCKPEDRKNTFGFRCVLKGK